MYCKKSYEPKSSKLKCRTQYFNEDKENLYTASFHARMQENHNPNCCGCRKCASGKNSNDNINSSSSQKKFYFNDRPFRENYCTDCSGVARNRNRNVFPENQHVDMHAGNYASVHNNRHRSSRGSMYGCDDIYGENVPLCKDVNSRGHNFQQETKTSDSTKGKVDNSKETWSSKHSEKHRNDLDEKSHQNDPAKAKLSRMSRTNKTGRNGNHQNNDDLRSADKSTSSCDDNRKTKDESTSSVKFTDSEKPKSSLGKGKIMDPEKEDSRRCDGDDEFQQKDAGSECKDPRSVKTEEESLKHDGGERGGGRDRCKVQKGSKRLPKRRPQKRPDARESEKPGGVDEWLFFNFVFDIIKKGLVPVLSWISTCLSIGWSLLLYFLLVLLLVVLTALSCIWTFLKRCVLSVWNILCSLWNTIAKKLKQSSRETSEQQPRRSTSRQRSDPLPEADELVSKLLASKDLDAYGVLGVSPSASDEEIKRSYREMAKIVHPDKNAHEDASEAFKIVQSAFEAIGDEEKRIAYQFEQHQRRVQGEVDEFFEMFMTQMQEMKNRIMCRACNKFHPRSLTDRLVYAARYCSECGVRHSAKEGNVWIETSHMGFKYYCYLCMDDQVYEVTEWGACQGLLRTPANSHTVFLSVKPNHSAWNDMSGGANRSNPPGRNKKKRKGKSNKNKKR